jgi:hypothetical protein
MRLAVSCATFALALGLAACGQSNTTTTLAQGEAIAKAISKDGALTTITGANGDAAQFSNGAAVAAQLPASMPIYPGAKVTTGVSGANAAQKTVSVAFETNASIADVIDFYKKRAAAIGLSDVLSSSESGSTTFMAMKDQRMLQIIASSGNGSTAAQLTWAAPIAN